MDSFTPTPECVNALPERLRRYVHDLETRCDPAGDVAALTLTRDQNATLAATLTEAEGELNTLGTEVTYCNTCNAVYRYKPGVHPIDCCFDCLAKADVEGLENEIDGLRDDISDLQDVEERLNDLKGELRDLEDEHERVGKTLEDVNAALEDAKTALDAALPIVLADCTDVSTFKKEHPDEYALIMEDDNGPAGPWGKHCERVATIIRGELAK